LQRPGDDFTKQRPNLGAGQEITLPPGTATARVEPVGSVEGLVDELVEALRG
jgi:hypothetical protein